MKMFLTRLGYGSKAVITGDVTQIDLPAGTRSGLKEAQKILRGIDDIKFAFFSEKNVVRHRLVQDIITAYERAHEEREQFEQEKRELRRQRAQERLNDRRFCKTPEVSRHELRQWSKAILRHLGQLASRAESRLGNGPRDPHIEPSVLPNTLVPKFDGT